MLDLLIHPVVAFDSDAVGPHWAAADSRCAVIVAAHRRRQPAIAAVVVAAALNTKRLIQNIRKKTRNNFKTIIIYLTLFYKCRH